MMHPRRRSACAPTWQGAAWLLAALAIALPLSAHKPVSARYSFEEHVRPIFERRCGGCHRPGGPAPMSLLSYKDSRPWAEAIKEEVLAERMPPWGVEDGVPLRDARRLSAVELDRIADWATGGAPARSGETFGRKVEAEPEVDTTPAAAASDRAAPFGDRRYLIEHTLAANRKREVLVRAIELGLDADRWLTGLRFTPGSDALVRLARFEIVDEGDSDGTSSDAQGELLLSWTPGDDAVRFPSDVGRRLPRGASVRATIDIRRPWNHEVADAAVVSALELATRAAPPRAALESVLVRPGAPVTLRGRIHTLTPLVRREESDVEVRAGATLLLRATGLRQDWPLTYRLAEPHAVGGLEDGLDGGAVACDGLPVWIELERD